MKIGIDARFYGPQRKGLGRYTQEVVDGIIKKDRKNDYVVFLYNDNFEKFDDSASNVKKVLVNARWYTVAEQFKMPLAIIKEHVDFMHFLHFNVPIFAPTKFVLTIHDLILLKFPTTRATTLGPILYKIKNLVYKVVIWLAVKRAQTVITISEYTKKDIIGYFNISDKKMKVIYEGMVEMEKRKDGDIDEGKILEKYLIKKPYLLYVGNAYPHKNLEGLLEVFKEIHNKNKDLSLVLVGKEDYFYNRLIGMARELGLWEEKDKNSPVIFAGYVPDGELGTFFKHATTYVFASFFEGFGLPPLEAMARHCPVVTSNKTCLPEILGDAALYFNPDDKKDMQEKIERIIKDKDLRKELVEKGDKQWKKYDWEDCVNEILEIYKKFRL